MTQSAQWEERECNKRLVNEVAEEQEVNISTVEDALQHYSEFIAATIKRGALEGVFVPYLGKFQVKLKDQQYKAYLHSLHPVFKKVFQKSAPENINEIMELCES